MLQIPSNISGRDIGLWLNTNTLEEEDKKIKKWMDKIIGDGPDMKINSARFHYEFYPTPLGIVGTVIDNITKQKFEFQSLV